MGTMMASSVDFRDYRNIFVNANQTVPRDDIQFGFVGDRKSIVFEPGMETVFNYPLVSEGNSAYASSGISISATSLVVDGAICGRAPYQSDRVSCKMAGYGWRDRWGEAMPEIVQNGEWLCAWLSGDMENPSAAKWYDRWYDAKKIPASVAGRVAATTAVEDNLIADFPSDLRFAPGCLYAYRRVGMDDVSGFVADIDASNLVAKVEKWRLEGCENTAPATSATLTLENIDCVSGMFGKRRISTAGDYGITFNASGYVLASPEASVYPKSSNMTVSVFLESDDWDDCTGDGIVDCGYHGGWKLGVCSRPRAHVCTVLAEDADGNQFLGIYDSQLNLKSTRTIDRTDSANKIYRVCADGEYWVWAITQGKALEKIDLDGNTIYSRAFPQGVFDNATTSARGIVMFGDNLSAFGPSDGRYFGYGRLGVQGTKNSNGNNVYVFDAVRGDWITKSVVSAQQAPNFNSDRNGFSGTYGKAWLDIDPTTERATAHYINAGSYDVYHGVVDSGYSYSKFCAVSKDQMVFFIERPSSGYRSDRPYRLVRLVRRRTGGYERRGQLSIDSSHGVPTWVVVSTRSVHGGVDDVVYVFYDIGYVEAYDVGLRKLWTKRIFSGDWKLKDVSCDYEYGRRFFNGVLYARFVVSTSSLLQGGVSGMVVLKCPLSKLSSHDWNMVSIVRRRGSPDSVEMYLNGKLVDSATYSGANYVAYDSECPMVLGATAGKTKALGDETGFANTKWNGSMDDLRIYRKALTPDDLKFLVVERHDVPSMVWNMQIQDKYFTEAVRRLYKMRIPGSKSAFYDISIEGFDGVGSVGEGVKANALDSVRMALPSVAPAYVKNMGLGFNGVY